MRPRLLVLTVALLAITACSKRSGSVEAQDKGTLAPIERETTVGVTTLTGANLAMMPDESAVDRVVAARCDREATCANVGLDRRYTNKEVCTIALRSQVRTELRGGDCAKGVDTKELDECLEAIRGLACSADVSAVSRIADCRAQDLCAR